MLLLLTHVADDIQGKLETIRLYEIFPFMAKKKNVKQ